AADFTALNIQDLSLAPKRELFANMVYAMQPNAIAHVVIDGKPVFSKDGLLTVAEQDISSRVNRLFERWGGA
ncbi:amidohydrolase, partial [Paenibacillus sepulcri]|nr:amidohydrolase [Paenibacillus sepulcri]